MKRVDLQAVVWKEGRHYVSQCLNVDIASFGSSKAKALAHLQEAVELYLEDKKSTKPKKVQQPAIASMTLQYA